MGDLSLSSRRDLGKCELVPPKEDAVYLADMRRNETPIYSESGGKKWITTRAEQIGEEESLTDGRCAEASDRPHLYRFRRFAQIKPL